MERVAPYWMPPSAGPPTGALGVTVALDLVIGRSAEAVVRIAYAQVYAEGMTLAVERLLDPYGARSKEDWQRPRPNDSESFVFGLRYSNGRAGCWPETVDRPPEQAIAIRGGSGGGMPNRSGLRHWVWPLPSPGRVEVSCRWREVGIEAQGAELTAEPILDAATRATEYWTQDKLPRHPGMLDA